MTSQVEKLRVIFKQEYLEASNAYNNILGHDDLITEDNGQEGDL